MSIDLSKIGYGVLVSAETGGGIVVSKVGYGVVLDAVTGGNGIVLSKIGYGVIIDTNTQTIRPGTVPDDSGVFELAAVVPAVSPAFIESDSEVYIPLISAPAVFIIPDRERNPYPTHLPYDIDELGSFLNEQQRTLREQHNKTQAGDTTFDYGLLLKGTPNQLFTLGSMGRFYHEDLGLTIARYVKFKSCVETPKQGAPVGYLATSDTVDWVVTNDLTKSSADRVVGVMCVAVIPDNDTYGWVVTEGPVPVPIQQTQGIIPAPETPYAWLGTGIIGIDVSGKILGRRWGRATEAAINAGELFVRLEGMSPQWFSEFIAEEVAALTDQLADHESRLDAAEPKITNLEAGSIALNLEVDALSQRLGREESARVRDIESVRNLLTDSTNWSAAILASSNLVRAEYQAADDELRTLINAVKFTADSNSAAISGWDLTGFDSRVTGLETQFGSFSARFANFDVDWPSPIDGQVLISNHTVDGDGTFRWFFEGLDFLAVYLPFTPSGNLVSTNVQDALVELDSEKVAKVTSTDNALARFDGTTGEIQDSPVLLTDDADLTGLHSVVIESTVGSADYVLNGEFFNGTKINIASATRSGYNIFSRARGSHAAPASTQTNDILGSFGFRGFDAVTEGWYWPGDGARISAVATESGETGRGTRLRFWTCANGSTTITERLRIEQDGLVQAFVNIQTVDEVYGVSWNGSLTVPTKNAVYDKIESLPLKTTTGLVNAVDDAAAAAGGVAVGAVYRNGSVLMVRVV